MYPFSYVAVGDEQTAIPPRQPAAASSPVHQLIDLMREEVERPAHLVDIKRHCPLARFGWTTTPL